MLSHEIAVKKSFVAWRYIIAALALHKLARR